MNDPIERFRDSFDRAAAVSDGDPTAATLATVDPAGRPSARIVLVKLFDKLGFRFFTNYNSPKARDLSANANAALLFFWPQIGEQVRVSGAAERLPSEASEQYWVSRPRASQLGAWASEQSQPLESRELLLGRLSAIEGKYLGSEVPRPPHWGGFLLQPSEIEFWISGDHRLHDRFLYRPDGNRWSYFRLNP